MGLFTYDIMPMPCLFQLVLLQLEMHLCRSPKAEHGGHERDDEGLNDLFSLGIGQQASQKGIKRASEIPHG